MSWSLGEIIRSHARERGGRPVLTFGPRTITWAEMDTRASRVAQGFLAAGLAAQDRVAFIDKNGPEYFEVLFGGGKANIVNVAVNWRLAPAEMAYIVNDAAARLLFVGPDFLPHLDEIEGSLKTVEKIVVIGGHARHESYDAWVDRHPAEAPETETAPEDVAMQLYTSGTTGLPKGAMLTNANLGTLVPFVGPTRFRGVAQHTRPKLPLPAARCGSWVSPLHLPPPCASSVPRIGRATHARRDRRSPTPARHRPQHTRA